ncbi:MAG: hypothetical protein ABIP12_00760 [Terriglobales bacterium]
MRLTTTKLFCLLVAAALWISPLAAQTIADIARENRKFKRTPSANDKVFTNDSLHLRPGPSIAEPGTAAKAPIKPGEAAAAAEGDEEAAPGANPEESKAAAAATFVSQIERAKSELATLQRELDIAARENKLRTAQFYADAGNRLRNERSFEDEQRKNQADTADKQKRIAATAAQLEALRSEARRAGVPAGMIP